MKIGERYLQVTYSDGSVYKIDLYYIADDYAKYSVKMERSKSFKTEEEIYDHYFNSIYNDALLIKGWFKHMDIDDIADCLILVSESHSSRIITQLHIVDNGTVF